MSQPLARTQKSEGVDTKGARDLTQTTEGDDKIVDVTKKTKHVAKISNSSRVSTRPPKLTNCKSDEKKHGVPLRRQKENVNP